MIVDTSAIAAVLFAQAESAALHRCLVVGAPCSVGAPTLAEAAIVLQTRMGAAGSSALRSFVVEYDVRSIPFGDEHWRVAARAFAMYGKGRHPARLDFGDCLTYATAKLSGELLLCVGGDFAQTDLELVPLPG